MNNRLGRQTVTFDNPPIIIETASTVGQKEGKGPLKSTFDVILDDDTLGEKSWEKSESMLQKKTALLALEKACRRFVKSVRGRTLQRQRF